MERERHSDHERFRMPGDDLPSDDNLNRHRAAIDRLHRMSDRAFDALDAIQSHQYLEQNVQVGGQ
jgi:hypothetical protein